MIHIGTNKKYYWLKLKDDYFSAKEIKKLRKIAGGDTYTIIYLKLQLLSLKNEGKLIFDGIEDTFYEEIALELDEEVENVKVTLMYLTKCGLMEEISETEFVLPQVLNCIGSETQVAERVRRFRENKQALLSNADVTTSNADVTKCNTEIEIEKDIELDKEKDIDIFKPPNEVKPPKSKKFIKPTLEEIQVYCTERNNTVNPQKFFDHYEANNWFRGKTKISDWKACVRTWEQREAEKPTYQQITYQKPKPATFDDVE